LTAVSRQHEIFINTSKESRYTRQSSAERAGRLKSDKRLPQNKNRIVIVRTCTQLGSHHLSKYTAQRQRCKGHNAINNTTPCSRVRTSLCA